MGNGTTDINVEREKLEIERRKLDIDQERLRVERFRAWWTGVSIFVPVIVAAASVVIAVWSQREAARSSFEIKAAEIVMSTDNPYTTHGKAAALAMLFPDRLPANFAKSFDPETFTGALPIDEAEFNAKKELLKLLIDRRDADRRKLLADWKQLFPEDKWVDGLK